MSKGKQKRVLRVPVSREPRLPAGVDMATLCKMKGRWPTRELSREELLDTYKSFFSSRFRAETLLLLEGFRKRYGDEIYGTMESIYYEMGKSEGQAERENYGGLLNKLVDIFVRPYCYVNEQLEMTEDRMSYKTLKCPFADLAKEMGLEKIGRHLCPPWHKGYGEANGYRWRMSKFLMAGDDSCDHTWEKVK